MPPRSTRRRVARGLLTLAQACGVTVVAGPGCFLFCWSDGTHPELQDVTTSTDQWNVVPSPVSPAAGVWIGGPMAWEVGEGGAARSFDGGFTWEILDVPGGLVAVDGAYEEPAVWVAGEEGLIGVVDEAGFTTSGADTVEDLTAISQGDDDYAVAVSAEGTVLTTEDGGDTWVIEHVADERLSAVDANITRNVWVTGNAGLLLHGDADGWVVQDLDTDTDLVGVAFASGERGMVAGANGDMWGTQDGGGTWTKTSVGTPISALAFTGPSDGEVALATDRAGNVWSLATGEWAIVAHTDDGAPLAAISALPYGPAIAVGEGQSVVFGTVFETHEEQVEVEDCPPYVGRPYTVDGEIRLATVRAVAPASPAAARWQKQAREEHGAVAAFARFARQIQALGAPAELVADALAAEADERRHTTLALERAAALGAPCTLGDLDIDESGAVDLREVALATAREGCVTETAAVYAALQAAAVATELDDRVVWRTIVTDETRHAALAWRFVRWAIAQDPSLYPAIAQVFARRPSSVPIAVWSTVIAPAFATLAVA